MRELEATLHLVHNSQDPDLIADWKRKYSALGEEYGKLIEKRAAAVERHKQESK
jgi:hypothetical protein